jgi:DNA-binding transcriptional MerR regulator
MMLTSNGVTVGTVTEAMTATEFTIDELAAKAGLPSRTIRFYQSKGALQSPTLRGRVAYYGKEHIERLRLIGSLQDRGLRIRAIRDLLAQSNKGERAVNEWLGLEKQLKEPWSLEAPRWMTEVEVRAELGSLRAGLLDDLVRLKQTEKDGDRYLIRSMSLLKLGADLDAAGISMDTSVGAVERLRKHLRRAAGELTHFFYSLAGEGFGGAVTARDLSQAYAAIRPLSLEATNVVFGEEIERALHKLIDSNVASGLTKKVRRKKRRRHPSQA